MILDRIIMTKHLPISTDIKNIINRYIFEFELKRNIKYYRQMCLNELLNQTSIIRLYLDFKTEFNSNLKRKYKILWLWSPYRYVWVIE